jgi:hypothetical protein
MLVSSCVFFLLAILVHAADRNGFGTATGLLAFLMTFYKFYTTL